MKNFSFALVILIISLTSISFQQKDSLGCELMVQDQSSLVAKDSVEWLSLAEAVEKSEIENRKILINVYKTPCGWCKEMERTTYQDQKIVKYINQNFYAVKLNAEQEEEIEFKNKVYKFEKNGKRAYNEFAVEMLRGRMSFPTIVFLDEKMNIIQPLNGYKNVDEFLQIMTYFGENHYKKTPWSRFQQDFKGID